MAERPRLFHLTTTDISLSLLLGPQLTAFKDAGYDVTGVSAPGPYVADLEALGIEHVPLRHATRAMAPHHDVLALRELHRLFRRRRPDIVHTHNPKPGLYGRFAARAARVPVVVNTVHGLYAVPEDRAAKRLPVYALERVAATCSDAELVQKPEDVETLARLRVPRSRLHLLGNGVDLSRFDPSGVTAAEVAERRAEVGAGPDDVVVGLVGRLVVEKGYREVFAAAAALRERAPTARLVVIGPSDPDKADALTDAEVAEARRAGVTFLGSRRDVVAWYAAFDVFLLASWREGFPRAAMEAAAMGLPIVATDIRGCRQVVDHGRTGLLVPPRDPDAIEDAVARLVADPSARARMGDAARAKATAEFDQQAQIDLTLAVYARCLAARDDRARDPEATAR